MLFGKLIGEMLLRGGKLVAVGIGLPAAEVAISNWFRYFEYLGKTSRYHILNSAVSLREEVSIG